MVVEALHTPHYPKDLAMTREHYEVSDYRMSESELNTLEPQPLRPNEEIQDSDSRYWINNLVVVWIAQFTVVVGFSFVFPFIPLFVLDLGVTDPGKAARYLSNQIFACKSK